jgi:hypothetical protein
VEKEKELKIKKELRIDEIGLYEVTFVNDKVVSVKDINGCIVKNNEVLLDYVQTNNKTK